MQTHREVVETTPTVASDRTKTSVTDPYAGRRETSIKITRAIYLIFGVIEALLVIRLVLKALAANAEAGFAQLIYAVTGPLVAPFMGLFGTPQAASGATLELHTLIALVIYGLLAWLLTRAAWLAFGEGRSASVARTESVQTRAR
jgi:YggT family protein